MKIIGKYRDEKTGGRKTVRCEHCKEPRIFKSFKAAKEYFESQRIKNWSSTRID